MARWTCGGYGVGGGAVRCVYERKTTTEEGEGTDEWAPLVSEREREREHGVAASVREERRRGAGDAVRGS